MPAPPLADVGKHIVEMLAGDVAAGDAALDPPAPARLDDPQLTVCHHQRHRRRLDDAGEHFVGGADARFGGGQRLHRTVAVPLLRGQGGKVFKGDHEVGI